MKRKLIGLALGIAMLIGAGPAFADVITFDNLSGANLDPFPATYTEGSFTVTPLLGTWEQGQVFGNPVPSVVLGPLYDPSLLGAIEVQMTGLGDFTFSSMDVACNNGSTDCAAADLGAVDGSLAFTDSFFLTPAGGSFVTLASANSSTPINALYILVAPGSGTTSMNLDNIVVTPVAVPEPSTLLLLGSGMLGLAAMRRFRKV